MTTPWAEQVAIGDEKPDDEREQKGDDVGEQVAHPEAVDEPREDRQAQEQDGVVDDGEAEEPLPADALLGAAEHEGVDEQEVPGGGHLGRQHRTCGHGQTETLDEQPQCEAVDGEPGETDGGEPGPAPDDTGRGAARRRDGDLRRRWDCRGLVLRSVQHAYGGPWQGHDA
jgi:hypothetical protein